MDAALELSAAQRRLVADYWWQRALGERTSWVGLGHVRQDMIALGAPSGLIQLAERAVADEYKHSLWCRDRAVFFGHEYREIEARSEARLFFPRVGEEENRLLRVAFCCLTETLGVVLLQKARVDMFDSAMRSLNHGHMKDEVQHSRLCWAVLSGLNASQRAKLLPYWPLLLDMLACVAVDGIGADHDELVAHGYISSALARQAHTAARRDVIDPGLSALDLWEA